MPLKTPFVAIKELQNISGCEIFRIRDVDQTHFDMDIMTNWHWKSPICIWRRTIRPLQSPDASGKICRRDGGKAKTEPFVVTVSNRNNSNFSRTLRKDT